MPAWNTGKLLGYEKGLGQKCLEPAAPLGDTALLTGKLLEPLRDELSGAHHAAIIASCTASSAR